MSVVNDGLPVDESAGYGPGRTDVDPPPPAGTDIIGHTTDPPTEQLALPALSPTSVVSTEAPSTLASPDNDTGDQPAQVLSPDPPPGRRRRQDSATDGGVAGDLFDGIAGPSRLDSGGP